MSEQNEREAFDIWISKYNIEKKQSNQTLIWIAYQAWQHQQQEINKLITDVETYIAVANNQATEIESLQAQLKVAVDALEGMVEGKCYEYEMVEVATEAINTINKMKGE